MESLMKWNATFLRIHWRAETQYDIMLFEQ